MSKYDPDPHHVCFTNGYSSHDETKPKNIVLARGTAERVLRKTALLSAHVSAASKRTAQRAVSTPN
jgi:hypothetical protein